MTLPDVPTRPSLILTNEVMGKPPEYGVRFTMRLNGAFCVRYEPPPGEECDISFASMFAHIHDILDKEEVKYLERRG